MYVSEIVIENVRGFRARSVELDLARPDGTFAGWTVIAGRNGTGKSTLLRAVALALAGPTCTRTLFETFRGWVHSGAKEASVRLKIVDSPEDQFGGVGKRPTRGFSSALHWELQKDGDEPIVTADPKQEKVLRGAWRGTWSENPPKGWFVAGYGPFRRLTGHAADAQRLMVGPDHVARLVSLFREDASLIECVQWLREVYLRRLEQRAGAATLEKTVLEILNDGLLPEGTEVLRVDSEGLWVKQGNITLPLRELSDGYRVTVALILDIVRGLYVCFGEVPVTRSGGRISVNLPGIVLADEIDAHLHVSWQQQIGFWLKSHFPRIQFIVSTHSPFICQAADLNGLIRLPAPGPGDSRHARRVSEKEYRRVVNGSSDDAVLTALFGLEHTWSRSAEKLRKEFAELRAKQIRGAATPKDKASLERLQLLLPIDMTDSVVHSLQDVIAQIDQVKS